MGSGEYGVSVFDRIAELFSEEDRELGPDVTLVYEWRGGYERTYHKREGGGDCEYRGSYHPDVICETGTERAEGMCLWCGRTLM